MGKPEAYVEDYLRKQAALHDCLCYKFTSPGTKGVPDDLLIYAGQTYYVETKSLTGNLRKTQVARIQQMRDHGASVAVCHTRTDIDAYLASFIPDYKPGNHNPEAEQKQPKKQTTAQPAFRPIIKGIRTDT